MVWVCHVPASLCAHDRPLTYTLSAFTIMLPRRQGHHAWEDSVMVIGHPLTGGGHFTPANPNNVPVFAVGQGDCMNAAHQHINYTTQKVGKWTQDQIVGRRRKIYTHTCVLVHATFYVTRLQCISVNFSGVPSSCIFVPVTLLLSNSMS